MKNSLRFDFLEKILTDLSFKFNCPINFLSSAGSISSPPTKSSIFVWATLALIRLRMHRRTEPIVSFVWDHTSKSSTCLPWFGNRTMKERCLPRKALREQKRKDHIQHTFKLSCKENKAENLILNIFLLSKIKLRLLISRVLKIKIYCSF